MNKIPTLAMAVLLLGGAVDASKMQGPMTHHAVMPQGPKIRVLLAKNVPSALIEAKGAYRVVQRDAQTLVSSGSIGKRYTLHAIPDGLRWGEEYPGLHHVTIVPESPQSILFVNGFQYKGVLDVYLEANQQVTVVNEVSIEDYVRSTASVQLRESLSSEALSAYLITARTEAYAVALTGQNVQQRWDVRAKDVSYFGHGVVAQCCGVDAGMEATRFIVLESVQGDLPRQLRLPATRLEELARTGCDAKQILTKCYPHTRLNVTTDPNKREVR